VLSLSTEAYDRGDKLANYQQIPSLDDVLLVHHDERKIAVWRRTGQIWSATEHVDGVISLALGCELSVAAIYRDPLA